MKNLILTIVAVLSILTLSYAQTTSIPNVIADEGVSDAKDRMDKDTTSIGLNERQIEQMSLDLATRQQAILALATQTPALQSAVDLCNSNPTSYCPGWLKTVVNWDAVASQRAQGVNWSDIKGGMTDVNWEYVSQANGINWHNVDTASINWANWPNAEANGENWAQFINNGGN